MSAGHNEGLHDPLVDYAQEMDEFDRADETKECAEQSLECWEMTARMLSWELLLTLGFAWNVLWAEGGIPKDTQLPVRGYVQTWQDLTTLWTYGLLTFYFTHLYDQRRHDYVLRGRSASSNPTRRLWLYFYAPFFAMGPLFSLASMIPGFQSSISSKAHVSPGLIVVLALLLLAVVCLLYKHTRHAYTVYKRKDFGAYLGLRALITVLLVIEISVASSVKGTETETAVHFELHHWCVAWLISVWCSFNTIWSAALLGGSAGVVVQGIGE
jgi:hypothetical protein